MDKDLEEFTHDLMLLINSFITETSDLKEVLNHCHHQLTNLDEDMAFINKVVRDGNGRPPIMSRLEIIEEKLAALKEVQDKWWQVWLAAVPGLLALITTGTFIL
jgi:hypothetical protein